jgi:hypothetical protein
MEKEERNEKEEFMSKIGNPSWYNLSPIRWPPQDSLNSKNSGNQAIHEIFTYDRELNENMMAIYWG